MSLGSVLSSAREERGLSVEDVSSATRIRGTLIRAIENDDFSLCGGAVYARGHIRSIARVVGVDSTPLIEEYDREHVEDTVPIATASQPQDPKETARADRRAPNWVGAMAAVLVVICIIAGVSLFANRGHSSSKSPQAKAPAPVGSASPKHSSPASPPPSAVAQLPSDEATMLVRTHGQTWLSVSSKAGTSLFQGLLRPGHQKLFTDKHGLEFVIGNAPAVDLVINGHDIGSPPSQGNVSRGHVVPGADSVQQA